MKLTDEIAEEIAAQVGVSGFPNCIAQDVWDVVENGSVPQGAIGDAYDEAFTNKILEALDARGVDQPWV